MLFMVEMDVNPPHDIDTDQFDALKATEKARSQELQKAGKWRHLWRVAGRYANVSIFDVRDAQELHDIMMSLPLYPFMAVKVTALCQHPSAIEQEK
ncbi:MAG: muconolactone Delta-isomerase [Sphingomonadales bacterium]|nr:muconolactone Delta-isomerase [Sphingomonadales bacterium]